MWQNWVKLQVKLEFSIQNWGKLQVKLEFSQVGQSQRGSGWVDIYVLWFSRKNMKLNWYSDTIQPQSEWLSHHVRQISYYFANSPIIAHLHNDKCFQNWMLDEFQEGFCITWGTLCQYLQGSGGLAPQYEHKTSWYEQVLGEVTTRFLYHGVVTHWASLCSIGNWIQRGGW